ncbi:hypothetical protein [Synechococcus sp. RS9902]|uniref:hypothetical protein n=1 Tax=Synechococcus sp. RS9902 TaxID=221345 RepID=UPI001644CB21|nr:hypothetical protein [Synechococcus sp. RS9902]QNI98428.1 hypothetical protein SynRS9902_02557 [Synechococcus sp. RS9902]
MANPLFTKTAARIAAGASAALAVGAAFLVAAPAGDTATVEVEPKRQPLYSYQEESVVKKGQTIKFTGTTTLHNTIGMGAAIGGVYTYGGGGSKTLQFDYTLSCANKDFDRNGDANYVYEYGWRPIAEDPTAQAVHDRYC